VLVAIQKLDFARPGHGDHYLSTAAKKTTLVGCSVAQLSIGANKRSSNVYWCSLLACSGCNFFSIVKEFNRSF